MEVQKHLHSLYDCLLKTSLDSRGNIVMPWNTNDSAAEWAWVGLLHNCPLKDLREYLEQTSNPMDQFFVQRAIEEKIRSGLR